MSEEPSVITFVPALVDLLSLRERDKGSPLTEAEVVQTRDGGLCIALPFADVRALVEARGYADLDPERAWEEWQAIRGQCREPLELD